MRNLESLPPTTTFFVYAKPIDKGVLDIMPFGEWRTRFIHNFHQNEFQHIVSKIKQSIVSRGWSLCENYHQGYLAVVTPIGTIKETLLTILDGLPCQVQEK